MTIAGEISAWARGRRGGGDTIGERKVSPLEPIYIRGSVDGDWGTESDKAL